MTSSLEPSGFSSESTSAPRWRWRMEDTSGEEVEASGTPGGFPSQSDAESWVGESWRTLLEQGVEAVTLYEGDRLIYGPMSLRSA